MSMRKSRKLSGSIRLHRFAITGFEQHLTDQEFRLYYLYARLADWDEKHGEESYGTILETIREIQCHYLPFWSIGKICYWRKALISKGLLQKEENRRIRVVRYSLYRIKNVKEAEQELQLLEQIVHQSEQPVRADEREETTFVVNEKGELEETTLVPDKIVQHTEQTHPSKETLKKSKEIVKESSDGEAIESFGDSIASFLPSIADMDKQYLNRSESERKGYLCNIRPLLFKNRGINEKTFPFPYNPEG